MDLIYTDVFGNDVGILHDYTLDLAFGSDENDFELVIDVNNHCCVPNSFIYIEDTEYGGIIDTINVMTEDDRLGYRGRTWHGILASKIIEAGISVSGELNEILTTLLDHFGLLGMFVVSGNNGEASIDNYTFTDYVDGYTGITQMLESIGTKLKLIFRDGVVLLSVSPIKDYSQDEQFNSDTVEMEIEKKYHPVNHLICVKKNESEDDVVTHFYVDENGDISESQVFFGLDEVTAFYETSSEDDKLLEEATKKIHELASDLVQLNFTSEEDTYDIGDIVGARENVTETFATDKISKKIVTISKGEVNIQYKVGE